MLRRGRMLCRSRCAVLIMLLTPCQRRNYQPKQERYPLVQPHFIFHSVIHYGLLDLKSCYASSPKFSFPNIAETALHSTAVKRTRLPIEHVVELLSKGGGKVCRPHNQLATRSCPGARILGRENVTRSSPPAQSFPSTIGLKNSKEISRFRRVVSIRTPSNSRSASLRRPAAVIYFLSALPPEEPLALPRPPATPSTPCHAPRPGRRHVRPRIPQGFRRTSPPCSVCRQPRAPGLDRLPLLLHRIPWRPAHPAGPVHSRCRLCRLHRPLRRYRQ